MARQIGKMLNTREPKIISGPGTDFNQNITCVYLASVSAQVRFESWNESETFGQYRFGRKCLLHKLSKDNNVSINVM